MKSIRPLALGVLLALTRVVSPRVARYSLDQFVGYPAFDQVTLTQKAIAEDQS